jgi:phosphoribosylaminoimidazole carboxylase (NCAIR synthetase)
MNVVFLSPHFPPNYYHFCHQLQRLGANVLGLADEPYDHLRPELRDALTEYYRVDDMTSYDQLLRACGYLTHRHGKIDRIDSHNEHWLETEARLRTDFNIPGPGTDEVASLRRKSHMKDVFGRAGITVARGRVVHAQREAEDFIDNVGYPVVAKPDTGVGAAGTYKIRNRQELDRFFSEKPAIDYMLEEFVSGTICSFDGLTDRSGHLVFYTAHRYSRGVMETVNEDDHVYYYSLRTIPADLEAVGKQAVRTFGIRERFFHIEFFRTVDQELVGLEVNLRPPGGFTLDMFNFANDIDIYAEWANVVLFNRFTARYSRPYHCCYVSRKFHKDYIHSHTDIMAAYSDLVVFHQAMPLVFSQAMGDYCYLIRSPDLDEIAAAAEFIQATH